MDFVIYNSEEIEHAKHILLNSYFQEKVNNGEMNFIQALIKQKQIDKDFERGREEIRRGDYVKAEDLVSVVKKIATETNKVG